MNSPKITLKQFLLDLLNQPDKSHIIQWTRTGESGEFKFMDPDAVSKLWGKQKGNPDMDYDKLSRALRYYYDTGDMKKVTGKNFVYRFLNGKTEVKVEKENAPVVFKSSFSVESLMSTPSPRTAHSINTPSPSNSLSSSTPSTTSPLASDESTAEKPVNKKLISKLKRKHADSPKSRGEPQARRVKQEPLDLSSYTMPTPALAYNPMMINYYSAFCQYYSQMMSMGTGVNNTQQQQQQMPFFAFPTPFVNQYALLMNSVAQMTPQPTPPVETPANTSK